MCCVCACASIENVCSYILFLSYTAMSCFKPIVSISKEKVNPISARESEFLHCQQFIVHC